LPLKPERLAERVNDLLRLADPHGSVAEMFRLILDMLALVQPELDISKARESIRLAARSRDL
jgi:hypothetical protein